MSYSLQSTVYQFEKRLDPAKDSGAFLIEQILICKLKKSKLAF